MCLQGSRLFFVFETLLIKHIPSLCKAYLSLLVGEFKEEQCHSKRRTSEKGVFKAYNLYREEENKENKGL
jgi:hypothetical protein